MLLSEHDLALLERQHLPHWYLQLQQLGPTLSDTMLHSVLSYYNVGKSHLLLGTVPQGVTVFSHIGYTAYLLLCFSLGYPQCGWIFAVCDLCYCCGTRCGVFGNEPPRGCQLQY